MESNTEWWKKNPSRFRVNSVLVLVLMFLAIWSWTSYLTISISVPHLWNSHVTLYMENPMDGGAWEAAVHRVAKSRTQLSDFTFPFHFHALEKKMATHSSVLAWRIPGMVEPGGLPSLGSHRVRHDWSDLAAAAAGTFQC